MKTNIFSVFSRVMALGLFLTVMVSCEKEIPVTSLTLDKAEATVQVGANLTLLPVIDPLNATTRRFNGQPATPV